MPSTVADGILGRGLSWVVVLGNGAIAVLLVVLTPTAFRDEGASPAQIFVFGAVAAAWVTMTWYLAVLLVLRPRRTGDELRSASPAGEVGLVVPGRVTTSVAASLAAMAWAVATLSGSMIARGGWRALLVVVAMALVAAGVDQGIAARQRRFLVLTPGAVEAGSFCGAARVAWDDIRAITVRQGFGGHLVFRIQVRDGAPSWRRLTRHPLHKARQWFDAEPLSLGLDPVLLGVTLLDAWEDARVRVQIGAAITGPRLVEPEWALRSAHPQGAEQLLRAYRTERAVR